MPTPQTFRTPASCRLLALCTSVLALATHGSAGLAAQTVQGRLLASGTSQPIADGVVLLLDTLNNEVARTVADPQGRFSVRAPAPGSYLIRGEMLGYRITTDGILDLGDGGLITIDFYLRPQVIALDPVEATVERGRIAYRERVFLERQGFYDRMRSGFGRFITPEDLDERPPLSVGDLFRSTLGVETVPGAFASSGTVAMRSCRRSGRFTGWVNGVRVYEGTAWPMERDVSLIDISAIEVYTRLSSLPLQYTVSGSTCGAILVWTK
jgi:hypothetical protein